MRKNKKRPWQEVMLGDIAQIRIGRTPARKEPSYWKDGTHMWLSIADLGDKYLHTSKERITNRGVSHCNAKPLPTGTVVMSFKLTIGKLGITATPLFTNEAICGFVPRSRDIFDPEFLYQILHVTDLVKDVEQAVKGATLNLRKLNQIRIQLPCLEIQHKIANILRTWDETIETTELLHATAQKRKRGLMQALLTGKYRFPEFKDQSWQRTRLGALGSFQKGKGLSKSKVGPTGAFPCVLYGELYTTYGEVIREPVSYTDLNEGLISHAGDILIPASTTTTGIDLAIASCILRDDVRLGGDINVFRRSTNDIDSTFLASFLTHASRHEIAALTQGLTIVHLKGSDLLNIRISVPPISEQHRIVDVFSSVEREIEILSASIEKLCIEKKALMQQLLTSPRPQEHLQ